MWSAQYRAACLQSSLFRVVTTRLVRKNREVTEWTLVANADIPKGVFIGFYGGDMSTEEKESLYGVKVNHVFIYPFADESSISMEHRQTRPLANMNEPLPDDYANCCMIVQDFLPNEVSGAPDDTPAPRFFRGLACFTCKPIKQGEELTWHYGRSYEGHRRAQGYDAGRPCKALIDREIFIPSHSHGVLRVMERVPHTCLFPVSGNLKSERISISVSKRKRRATSDDESDTSSSGSGHIPKYTPNNESRQARLERRTTQNAI